MRPRYLPPFPPGKPASARARPLARDRRRRDRCPAGYPRDCPHGGVWLADGRSNHSNLSAQKPSGSAAAIKASAARPGTAGWTDGLGGASRPFARRHVVYSSVRWRSRAPAPPPWRAVSSAMLAHQQRGQSRYQTGHGVGGRRRQRLLSAYAAPARMPRKPHRTLCSSTPSRAKTRPPCGPDSSTR